MKKLFKISEEQVEINKQDYNRTNRFLLLSTFVFASWFIVDWFVIDKSWIPYCVLLRILPITLFFIYKFLPENILEKYFHIMCVGTYILVFSMFYPLYFHTTEFFFYFTCTFIVPILSPTALVVRPCIQMLYPLIFLINTFFYWDEIIVLPRNIIIFSAAYSSSVFALTQLVSYVEFRNRVEKLILNRRLEKAIEDKTSLVRILVHDISNPLNIMKNKIKKLKSSLSIDDSNYKNINAIERSSDSIIKITNKVKEIEMQKGFDVKLDFKEVELKKLVLDLKDFFDMSFEEKDVILNYVDESKDKIYILADETIVKENIISNLLTNALKFSAPGDEVTLGIKKIDKKVCLYVKDHGEGIDKEIQETIFDSNVKTSHTGTMGEKGTGFGLPIAKLFTDKMNGNLFFESLTKDESPKNHGTTFFLQFDYLEK